MFHARSMSKLTNCFGGVSLADMYGYRKVGRSKDCVTIPLQFRHPACELRTTNDRLTLRVLTRPEGEPVS
jgi:hypothetical protein